MRKTISAHRPPPTIARRRLTFLAILLLLGLGAVLFFGWKGWTVYQLAQTLRTDIQALERSIQGADPSTATIAATRSNLGRIQATIETLDSEFQLFYPALPLLEGVPTYGPTLATSEALLDTAAQFTLAADATLEALQPVAHSLENTETMLPTVTEFEQIAATGPQIATARTAFDAAQAKWQTLPLEALHPRLRVQLERVDPLLPVMDTGLHLLATLQEAAPVGASLLTTATESRPGVTLASLGAYRSQLVATQEHLAAASATAQTIELEALPAPLRAPLEQAITRLPEAQSALEVALILPELLGADEPRTYLLLLQNPDELRPTGGFISAAGTITLSEGRIADLLLGDSGIMDNFDVAPYPVPPEPLQRYMGIYQWVFRDSNWSPDFPTAAWTAQKLYTKAKGAEVDGVIAITPTAIRSILEVLEPLTVAGEAEPLTVATIDRELQNLWQPKEALNQAWNERKTDYLNRLSAAFTDRLEEGLTTGQLLQLGGNLRTLLDTRHVLISVNNSNPAAVLARNQWDGAVVPGMGDFLLVVDANVGYNKANANITQVLTYTVDLRDPTAPVAEAIVHYHHAGVNDAPCEIQVVFLEGTYETMTNACYWNYTRLFVPAGSQLLTANQQPLPAELVFSGEAETGEVQQTVGEASTTVFSRLVLVPTGGEFVARYRYELPATVLEQSADGWTYRLRLQKQSGREAIAAQVQVLAPSNASLTHSSWPVDRDDRIITFDAALEQDQELILGFAKP